LQLIIMQSKPSQPALIKDVIYRYLFSGVYVTAQACLLSQTAVYSLHKLSFSVTN